MDRRDFLKLAALTGMGVCSPFPARAGSGEADLYEDGPLFLMLHASGGWDQTMFMDPKGTVDPDDPVNRFSEGEIAQVGEFRLAPTVAGNHLDFFEQQRDNIVVVHGYDVGVLAHSSAQRYSWTGTLRHTHPSIGALIAAVRGPGAPLSFLSHGGTAPTHGEINKVRSSELATIRQMAEYNTANTVRGNPSYYDEHEQQLLEDAIKARMEKRLDGRALPRERRDVSRLQTVYLGHDLVDQKLPQLPTVEDLRDIGGEGDLERQAALAMASYQAGLTVSATLELDDFDSHDGNDLQQYNRLNTLVEGLSGIVRQAKQRGVEDYYLVVMSDFGRSPSYNGGGGKGHYPVASMMVLSPNIDGNRVVGETSPKLQPKRVDPSSLQVDGEEGVQLRPEHIHKALRRMAGIAEHPLCTEKFPLQQHATEPLFPEA
jgi:uncharacterized protein (DUF1501 family)